MSNERNTESLVREHFRADPFYSSTRLEEQQSSNVRISECLAHASKTGNGKSGHPEFIISFPSQNSDYLIIVECKANRSNHESRNRDKPRDYAVDGVLHYSKFLASDFNVISLAVSGETQRELCVSSFIQTKGSSQAIELPDKTLLSIYDYVKLFKNEQFSHNLKDYNIIENAIELNTWFHQASVSESMRNTFVSAILLGLQDDIFRDSYTKTSNSKELADLLLDAVKRVLSKAAVRNSGSMISVYSKIVDEPLVKNKTIRIKKKEKSSLEFFINIIKRLHKNIYPLSKFDDEGYDVLGRFYTEFVRFAASKQKQGLVLTPSHVTSLFCDLVDLKATDIVYDPCCGTGSFLIAAMKRMIELAGNNSQQKDNIRRNQLLGVELRPEMFTFACSNMMMRGDGKSNLECGDCFDHEIQKQILARKPNIAFLNPPYDQGTDVQLQFISTALDMVKPEGGMVVAIVQMSCALKDDKETRAERANLLSKHHLVAVISMPDQLFYPVGVVTCIMVFQSGIPNKGRKTWFGYLKNDGMILKKNKGRIDSKAAWEPIRQKFLDAYRNKDEIPGLSVKHEVAADDEWCAEAYMETDYSSLSIDDFQRSVREYVAFNVKKPYIKFEDE